MVFLRKYVVFQRMPERSRGGPWGARATSRGGSRDPFGGNPLTRGGPEGGPREPFFLQGPHLLNRGAPKTIKKPLSFMVFSPLGGFEEIVYKGPKGAGQQGRIQGVQGGSQMAPQGPWGVPGGGQGGPRGSKGPSRRAKTLFKNHYTHRGDFREALTGTQGPTGGYRGYNKEGTLRSELVI